MIEKVVVDRTVLTPMARQDGTEIAKPLGYEFECPTGYDRLFSGLVVPKVALAATVPGAGAIGPEHLYDRAEDGGVDFGEVLRRVMAGREMN